MMPLHATRDKEAIYAVCNGCVKTLQFFRHQSDADITAKLTGWCIGNEGTVWCPRCAILAPVPNLRPIASFFNLNIDNAIHAYQGSGPPGNCRLCGRIIGPEDIWLEHSPNYPHVPPAFQRFPAHKECWRQILQNYTLNGASERAEQYRAGW